MKKSLVRFFLLSFLVSWPGHAAADYTFYLVDLPFAGAEQTAVSGAGAGDIIGRYRDAAGHDQGFLKTCLGLTVPLLNVVPRAKSTTAIGGWYTSPPGRQTGFVLIDGTFRPVEGPRDARRRPPVLTEVLDVNDAGAAVGTYQSADGVFHGFHMTPPYQFETIDVPGAVDTALLRIANTGDMLARATAANGSVSYLLWHAGTFTPLPLPSLPNLELVGRLPSGVLIGNTDTGGFLFDGTTDTVTLIRHPDSSLTRLFGNDEDGRLYGRVIIAGISHGFLAGPQGLPDPCASPPERKEHERSHRLPR